MTPKVTGSLEVEVTYFMTPKVTVTPKNHGVIRGRHDLLYDPKVTVTFVVGLT